MLDSLATGTKYTYFLIQGSSTLLPAKKVRCTYSNITHNFLTRFLSFQPLLKCNRKYILFHISDSLSCYLSNKFHSRVLKQTLMKNNKTQMESYNPVHGMHVFHIHSLPYFISHWSPYSFNPVTNLLLQK